MELIRFNFAVLNENDLIYSLLMEFGCVCGIWIACVDRVHVNVVALNANETVCFVLAGFF